MRVLLDCVHHFAHLQTLGCFAQLNSIEVAIGDLCNGRRDKISVEYRQPLAALIQTITNPELAGTVAATLCDAMPITTPLPDGWSLCLQVNTEKILFGQQPILCQLASSATHGLSSYCSVLSLQWERL